MTSTIQTLTAACHGGMMANASRYAANDWFAGRPDKLVAALNEHQDVHEWAVDQFMREWSVMPPPKVGGHPDDWKKEQKQRLKACFQRVKDAATTKWKLLFFAVGALTFLAFGLTGVVLLILGATFSWLVESWLSDNVNIKQARASAGYA